MARRYSRKRYMKMRLQATTKKRNGAGQWIRERSPTMKTSGNHSKAASALHKDNNASESEDIQPLRCWDCNLNFTNKSSLYDHLLFHIKQPKIILNPVHLPPLKITLKSTAGKQFEIVHSPSGSGENSPVAKSDPEFNLAEEEETHSQSPISYEKRRQSEEEGYQTGEGQEDESNETLLEVNKDGHAENIGAEEETVDIIEDENVENNEEQVSINDENEENHEEEENHQDPEENLPTCEQEGIISNDEDTNFDSVPGAEPTPPPEPSPELPKIRIKTTGLLKETNESSVTITEISDDESEKINSRNDSSRDNAMMSGKDDILSFISNNESRAKDFGFTTSDSEFLPVDRIDDRNRANNAMQIYNQGQMQGANLGSIAGLPMEALAQQVSRLQPGNGMHQQNVLINIQQFPQAPPPPQPQYQPPPPHMYHPPPQPMYHQPYQPYQPPPPPNRMYYPPAPGYPQHMPPPGQPQMPQMPPMMGQVPVSQQQNVPQQSQQYRQPMMPIRPNGPPPRPMHPQRLPVNPRQPMMPSARQPMTRQRAPMPPRPAGNGRGGMAGVRGVRPARMPAPVSQNGQVRQQQHQHQQISNKRNSTDHLQNIQMKRKKLDVLTPDKDDDDCQVICMQPKNTDGGLPQIESVQGGTSEPENNIMHLSDSITLSVRNPQPRPASPKKSDAKAVANILATRGITVTATPKSKQPKGDPVQKSSSPSTSINLNGAVSIIPSAKTSSPSTKSTSSVPESSLPTVDLTDDTVTTPTPPQKQNNPVKPQRQSGLPFKCDLCPAQYPNAVGLSKHRQNYHKTTSGMCEIGVPLINLKQPGIFQKLSSIGINNYIPLHQPGPDSLFALPIINARNATSVAALGSATMLTLGPVRNIPRPNGANKQPNKKVS